MSIGLIRGNTVVGLEEEVTEGTFVAPSGTGKYMQVLQGFGMKPAREVIDRALITSSPGKEAPRLGKKSVTATVPVEFRASGTEGAEPDFDALLKGALGSRRQLAARITTKAAGNTSTVLQIEDADIASLAVGDCILVLKAGAHEVRPILSKTSGAGTATVTLAFALAGGAPGASVQIAKFTTYLTASSGHPSLSLAYYWGNQVREAMLGGRVTSMNLEGFQAGKVASLGFGLEGLNFTHVDGAAPHTPAYDSGLPPIILNACIWRDGTLLDVNAMTLGLTNEIGFLETTCSANGRTAGRVRSREISGNIVPYKDDTSVDLFDDWVAGTQFSLFAVAYNPSTVSGEMELGSVCAIWLPKCMAVEQEVQDIEDVLVDAQAFRATRGSTGTDEEMYLTLI